MDNRIIDHASIQTNARNKNNLKSHRTPKRQSPTFAPTRPITGRIRPVAALSAAALIVIAAITMMWSLPAFARDMDPLTNNFVAGVAPAEKPAEQNTPADLVPTGLTATEDDNGVSLSWAAPAERADDVTGYAVQRAEGTAGFGPMTSDTGSAATTYSDTTIEAAKAYRYRVAARRGSVQSEWSGEAPITTLGPPGRPAGITTTSVTSEAVAIAWDGPSDGTVTGYEILRRDRRRHDFGHFITLVDDTGTSTASYEDQSVRPGESYVYRVKAINRVGRSQWSTYVRADVPATATHLAPGGFTAIADDGGVALAWDAPEARDYLVTGYRIQRAQGAGAFSPLVGNTGSTARTYTDTTANVQQAYRYRVAALRGADQSDWSGEATVAPRASTQTSGETIVFLDQDPPPPADITIDFDQSSFTVVEGQTATYQVALTAEPSSDVTITPSGAGLSFRPASLTFTSTTWDTEQTITVTASEDNDTANGSATIAHAATGASEFAGATLSGLSVTVTDDDPVVSISAVAEVAEGGALTFNLSRTGYINEERLVRVEVTEDVGGGHWSYLPPSPPASATFPDGSSATSFTVSIAANKVVGDTGTVTATVLAPGTSAEYYGTASDPEAATASVIDEDQESDAQWELSLNPTAITEGDEGTVATLSVSNGYTFAEDRTVSLYGQRLKWAPHNTLHGRNEKGETIDATFTIAAGQSGGEIRLVALDTQFFSGEVIQNVPLKAQFNTAEQLDENLPVLASAVLPLTEDEPIPEYTLSWTPSSVTEGETFTVTFRRTPISAASGSVNLSMSDPQGVVTTPFTSGKKNVSAGQGYRSYQLSTEDDLVDEPNGVSPVTFTLSNPQAPDLLGKPHRIVVNVLDDDVKPGVPQSLSVSVNHDTADLSWTTGDPGSQPIIKYQYRVSGDSRDTWNPNWTDIPGSDASTTSHTVSSIDVGEPYVFEVRAVNAVGEGEEAWVGIGAYSLLLEGSEAREARLGMHRKHGRPWRVEYYYFAFEWPSGVVYDHAHGDPLSSCDGSKGTGWECWDSYSPGQGFSHFELWKRKRSQGEGYPGWTRVEDVESRIMVPYVSSVETRIEIDKDDLPKRCQAVQFRVRARYDNRTPISHSRWVMAEYDRTTRGRCW